MRSRLFEERKDCLLLDPFLSKVRNDSLVSMLGWRLAIAEAGREAAAVAPPRKKESRFESEEAAYLWYAVYVSSSSQAVMTVVRFEVVVLVVAVLCRWESRKRVLPVVEKAVGSGGHDRDDVGAG